MTSTTTSNRQSTIQWQRWAPPILYVALLSMGALWLGNPSHNLWSLRYLWQATQHPVAAILPVYQSADVPATHRSGHLWQARALLAAGYLLQAESLLQPALAQGDPDAQRVLAEILVARGEFVGAVQQWTQVGAVDDILVAARQAVQQGQRDAALTAYRTAYELAPERTILPFAQFLRKERQDATNAETLLRTYITAMPTSRYLVSWLRELGALYREQAAWNQAVAIYTQLVAAMPDSATDWVQLGWVYYERGNGAEQALSHFQQAIAVAPQEGDGYYAIGTLFSRGQQYQEADSWYAQAVEREPNQRGWWLSRATAAQKAGDLALAVRLYETLQQQFPDFAQAHYQAAWAYREVEDKQGAVAAIETALRLLENNAGQPLTNASYYARAGQIYEWAGQLQQAVEAYKKASRLDPERKDVQTALLRLN